MKPQHSQSKQPNRPKSSSYTAYLKKKTNGASSHYNSISYHGNILSNYSSKSKDKDSRNRVTLSKDEGSRHTSLYRPKYSKSDKQLNNPIKTDEWISHKQQNQNKNRKQLSSQDIRVSLNRQRQRERLVRQRQLREKLPKGRDKLLDKPKYRHYYMPHQISTDKVSEESGKSGYEDIYATGDRYKIKSSKPVKKGAQSLESRITHNKKLVENPYGPHKNNSAVNISVISTITEYLTKKQIRSKSALGQISSKNKQEHGHSSSAHGTIQQSVDFNFSYRTKKGTLYTNPNKPNQDSLLVTKDLITKQNGNIHLFCVADGHGVHGHHVSQTLVENLAQLVKKELSRDNAAPPKALFMAYDHLQKILTQNKKQINIEGSGSTMVTVVLDGRLLTCANAGDSRAILARQVDKKCWEIIYLSEDHKPSCQKEKKRIAKLGGRIHAFRDQNGASIGPLRVWLPNKNVQGLAMSRSMGDNISKPIGVTHEPELIKVSLQERDKFLLLASDGVWEFLKNQEVLQLIVPYYKENKLQEACDALLKLAYERWTVEDCSVVDDITFILIFFWK